jgi:hypothetical protein
MQSRTPFPKSHAAASVSSAAATFVPTGWW